MIGMHTCPEAGQSLLRAAILKHSFRLIKSQQIKATCFFYSQNKSGIPETYSLAENTTANIRFTLEFKGKSWLVKLGSKERGRKIHEWTLGILSS